MGMFDNLIKIDNKGNIFLNQWYEWVHPGILNQPDWFREILRALMQLLGHCSKCTALSGCYFFADKIPSQPQHDNCDCMKKVISINIVSNHIHAECDIRKFTEYIFKDDETSKGKKELFESLGFDKDDAAYLQLEFCRQAEEQYLHGNYILKSRWMRAKNCHTNNHKRYYILFRLDDLSRGKITKYNAVRRMG